jgi:hypothetical protein
MSKFNSPLAERLYELSLDGSQDAEIGDAETLGWYARFNREFAILHVDSQGFVDAEEFETLSEFTLAWQGIEDEYVLWDREQDEARERLHSE